MAEHKFTYRVEYKAKNAKNWKVWLETDEALDAEYEAGYRIDAGQDVRILVEVKTKGLSLSKFCIEDTSGYIEEATLRWEAGSNYRVEFQCGDYAILDLEAILSKAKELKK